MKKNIIIAILSIISIALGTLCVFLFPNSNKNSSRNLEIERKYLIDINNLPAAFHDAQQEDMVQTYINFSPEMRVRKINNLYHFFTMKLPKDNIGLSREEIEIAITIDEYEELLTKKVGMTIYKVRHQFYENSFKIEIDIYSHELLGLAVVEVEFNSVKKSKSFVPPLWFGLEVTSDLRYKNANLAQYGLPI